ncbi:MAG: alpha/beta hydrolase [Reinekea sp.]
MGELGGQSNYADNEDDTPQVWSYYFSSPANPMFYWLNGLLMSQIDDNESYTTDYSDQMYKITVPSAIFWGRYDGICPLDMAYDAYDNLGTPSVDKRLVIFNYSAHSPMIDEPDKFTDEVADFIERYR